MRSRKGLKKVVCLAVAALITMGIFGMNNAEASRKSMNLDNVVETKIVRTRKVEVGGKLFDVCINQTEKTITVKGYVNDWEEMDRVEGYFKHRAPSDYQVICQLDFGY